MIPHSDSPIPAGTPRSRPVALFPTARRLGAALVCALAVAAGPGLAAEPDVADPDTSYLAGEVTAPGLDLMLEQAQRLATANSPAGRSAMAALRSARGARMG
ncbi:MAG: hypothetical protein ACRENJ_04280, partial [Candidatus Eiseniibacteriota bacterium]